MENFTYSVGALVDVGHVGREASLVAQTLGGGLLVIKTKIRKKEKRRKRERRTLDGRGSSLSSPLLPSSLGRLEAPNGDDDCEDGADGDGNTEEDAFGEDEPIGEGGSGVSLSTGDGGGGFGVGGGDDNDRIFGGRDVIRISGNE